MSFTTIKSKLKEKVLAVDSVYEVSDYPNQDFGGFPAVIVRTNGNTSEYLSTSENDEVYSFSLFVFQIIEGAFTQAKAREVLETACDDIRDAIDQDEFLDGIALPSGRSILGVRPTVSNIGEDDSGKYAIAEIELAVRVSKLV